jgi:hypothetical protein
LKGRKVKVLLSLVATLGFGLKANAVVKPIVVESDRYSSTAAEQLDQTQGDLAIEAIKACGKKELVAGVSRIQIFVRGINEDSDNRVGFVVVKNGVVGLTLNYPKITAYAVAHCK